MASRFDIRIRSEAKKIRYPLSRLKKTAGKILKILGWKKSGLSILLLNDAGIRKLNRKYLNHDRPTDVIAFGTISKSARFNSLIGIRRTNPALLEMVPLLGDIAISLETARRMAKELKTSLDYEIHLYLCHGILHLMGYDDHKPKDRAKMWAKQERILKKIWPYKKPKRSS